MAWIEIQSSIFFENEGLAGNPVNFVNKVKGNFAYLKALCDPPALVSAEVPAAGTPIILTFDKAVKNLFFTDVLTAFECNAGAMVLTAIARGADPLTLEIKPDAAFEEAEPILLDFTGVIPVLGADNVVIHPFVQLVVTNNTEAPA